MDMTDFFFPKIISESNLKSKPALSLALIGKSLLLNCNILFLSPCEAHSVLFLNSLSHPSQRNYYFKLQSNMFLLNDKKNKLYLFFQIQLMN